MKLATPQINYCLENLRTVGIVDQGRRNKARGILRNDGLTDDEIEQVVAALPDPPRPAPPPLPAVPAPKPEPERSQESIAATFRRLKGEDQFKVKTAVQPEPEVKAVEAEEETEETAPNGTPFLLPIADMPGYSVDPWGRPHADKRTGRKAGPVGLDKFFTSKGRKDKSPRFVCGYRVRIGEKRKRYRPTYFAMARFFAEQKYLNGED